MSLTSTNRSATLLTIADGQLPAALSVSLDSEATEAGSLITNSRQARAQIYEAHEAAFINYWHHGGINE